MSKSLKLAVMGINHGCIYDMLDEMLKKCLKKTSNNAFLPISKDNPLYKSWLPK